MGEPDDSSARVDDFPPIPEAGLAAVLSGWSGRGTLFDALSVPDDERDPRRWTSHDIRLRADRILLSVLDPMLARWPKRVTDWSHLLPATRSRTRVTREVPFAGVAWAQTRRTYGWPPKLFLGKESARGADMLAVQVLRWCADRVVPLSVNVSAAFPDVTLQSSDQLRTISALLEVDPLVGSSPITPARTDLTALRREGAPWGSVADVAHELLSAEKSLDQIVARLLMPDDGIRWRLFHLAVLGSVLHTLRAVGCHVTSVRPLSPASSGPNYEVLTPSGVGAQLWFEGAGVWAYFRKPPPFVEATHGVRRAHRTNGADVLLLSPDSRALIVECKYSWNPDVVARDGYYQAVAYGAEAKSRLVDQVVAVTVGPEPVVQSSSFTEMAIGKVGTVPPSGLDALVREFVFDLEGRQAGMLNMVARATSGP